MHRNTLARVRLDGTGWAHPYGRTPFSPVFYADGGDGDGSGSGGNPPPGSPPVPGPPPVQPPPPPATPPGTPSDSDVKSLPDWAQKALSDARAEAGKARTTAKENAANEARNQLAQDIGKALGLVSDDDKAPTPEELTQQLTQSRGALTAAEEDAISARVELQVYKTATRLGANADALLDSRAFCDTIDSLDPSKGAEEFNKQVETAITTALESNPQLRMVPGAPRRGGGEFPGAPGATGRPTSLGQAVAAGLSG